MPVTRTELDHRSDDYADVTLLWISGDGRDEAVVSVRPKGGGATFEIVVETYLALDVFNHPFTYMDFAAITDSNERLAA